VLVIAEEKARIEAAARRAGFGRSLLSAKKKIQNSVSGIRPQ
jgi:hypothetical protein